MFLAIPTNRYFPLIPAIALGIFFLAACEKEVPIELNDQKTARLVVEGRITNENKAHAIRLTKTLSYFNSEPAPVPKSAEVYIIEEDTETRIDLSLEDDSLGYFRTPVFKGTVGMTYSLFVNDNSESYKATAYLDTVTKMDSINYIYEYINYFEQGFYKLRMSAFEPPPLGNVYMFFIYKNDTLFNDKLVETPYENDLLYNNTYLANIELMWMPQEEVTLDTNTIRIEMLSISQEEYDYNNTFLNETYGNGSVFTGPPANIESNMKNTSGGIDGLGFFGASSLVVLSMEMLKVHDESTNNPDYEKD